MDIIRFARGSILAISLGLFCLAVVGCAHPVSRSTRDLVNTELTYSMVMQNPKTYIGSIVLWGGAVEKVLMGAETTLLINQMPLNGQDHPKTEETEGEFIAHTPQPLDLEVYRKGTKVTLAGEIDGVEEKDLGPMEYARPRVRIMEIHPWEERLWGIFPLSRKRGWEVDEGGPLPSPFELPGGERTYPSP